MQFKKIYKCMATAALVSQIITFAAATPASHVFAEEQQQEVQQKGFYSVYYETADFKKPQGISNVDQDTGGHLIPKGLEDTLDDDAIIKSARWIGTIKPKKTGDYKFSFTSPSDQHVIMKVAGKKIFITGTQQSIHLDEGNVYDVSIEYKNEEGISPSDFKLDLYWSNNNGAREVIPEGIVTRKKGTPLIPETTLFKEVENNIPDSEQTNTSGEPNTSDHPNISGDPNTPKNGWVFDDKAIEEQRPQGEQFNGLYTWYYSNTDFKDPVEEKAETLSQATRGALMNHNCKAIRWLGEIRPETTGDYNFQIMPIQLRKNIMIEVDGHKISPAGDLDPVHLEAGKSYKFFMEYKNEDIVHTQILLGWSKKGDSQFVWVPAGLMFGNTKPVLPKTGLFGNSNIDSHTDAKNQNIYYYENGKKVTGLKEIGGQTYYFNSDGMMQTGIQKVNNKLLYFYNKKQGDHPIGSQFKGTDFVDIDNQHAAYVESGVVQTGEIHLNNKMLIADTKGVLQSEWQIIRGKKYYIADVKQGVIKGASIVIDAKRYGFNLDGTVIENGVLSLGTFKPNVIDIKHETVGTIANTYIFENGAPKTGEGLPSSGPIGILAIPNSILKKYLQDDGLLVILSTEDGNKKLYYYGSDYKKVTGWRTVGNDKYYFNPKDEGAAMTGIQTIEEQTLLFDENGKLQEHVVHQTGE